MDGDSPSAAPGALPGSSSRPADLARHRAAAALVGGDAGRPTDVVRHLLAVQGQEFAPACWAIAQRCRPVPTLAAVQQLFDDGALLRTHVLRPTWHVVLPEDIGWLLDLTGPRVLAGTASVYRREGLDAAVLDRAMDLLVDAFGQHPGRALTKKELDAAVAAGGVDTGGLRSSFILGHAELTGLICGGPRVGKVHGYRLLADAAPHTRRLPRHEALGELVRRYFTSHGPATVHDLRWWSSLTIADIRAGIEEAGDALVSLDHDGRTYYLAADPGPAGGPVAGRRVPARLLPIYDEYLVAFSTSRWLVPPKVPKRPGDFDPGVAGAVVVRDATVIGEWRGGERAGGVTVDVTLATPPTAVVRAEVGRAAKEYGAFVGRPVAVVFGTSS